MGIASKSWDLNNFVCLTLIEVLEAELVVVSREVLFSWILFLPFLVRDLVAGRYNSSSTFSFFMRLSEFITETSLKDCNKWLRKAFRNCSWLGNKVESISMINDYKSDTHFAQIYEVEQGVPI